MDRVYDAEILSMRPDARALSYEEACAEVRAILVQMGAPWANETCEQIGARLAQDCTIFKPADGWGAYRLLLTGSAECPPPGTGGGSNNTLLIALVGLGVVGAVAAVIASKGTKKVLVARVR